MEDNDIAADTVLTLGCMFEGLLVTVPEEEEEKRGIFPRRRKSIRTARRWQVNEMPMKALIHLTTKLQVRVEVYTYMEEELLDDIEAFLARRGAICTVHPAYDYMDLAEIIKFDRDIHQFYTTSEHDAQYFGVRATVVLPTQTWGF
jgi:5,10-methylenetetrahydrofolate reductase